MHQDPLNPDKDVESLLEIVNSHYIAPYFRDERGRNRYSEVYRGEFVLNLVRGVLANSGELDSRISGFLQGGRTIDSLDSVLLQSLRLAGFEMGNSEESRKVIVSEYVDLVAEFCDRACTAFANGVLDRMASTL
jgi:transcription termination factor NusB